MKAQMIEKSGFPKPLGLLLILIIMSLLCLVQCVFSQPLTANITDNKIYCPVVEEEAGIQVEAWMIDDTCWIQNHKSGFKAEEFESEISIEPWMLNFEEFESELADDDLEIKIEAWMVDDSYWLKNYKSGFEAEESDPEKSIEPWMLNFEEFEQKLTDNDPEIEIEEWMVDDSSWLIPTDSYIIPNEEKEEDEEIKLEEWMCDLKYWKIVNYIHEIEEDK